LARINKSSAPAHATNHREPIPAARRNFERRPNGKTCSGSALPVFPPLAGQGRTNVWREITSPRTGAKRHKSGFVLLDIKGKRLSFHRTVSGALRARRERIVEAEEITQRRNHHV
jgi:hypothetical protein